MQNRFDNIDLEAKRKELKKLGMYKNLAGAKLSSYAVTLVTYAVELGVGGGKGGGTE